MNTLEELFTDMLKSKPTYEGEKASAVLKWLYHEHAVDNQWFQYISQRNPDTADMCLIYVGNHSRVGEDDDEVSFYTSSPMMLIHIEDEDVITVGSLYSNGAVILSKIGDVIYPTLYIDRKTASIFNYPTPS